MACLSLPLEIWIECILPSLAKRDILNLALTCKDICGIVINDKVWKQFYNDLSKRKRNAVEGGYRAKCVSYGKDRKFDKFMKTRKIQRRWVNSHQKKIDKLETQLEKEKTLLQDSKEDLLQIESLMSSTFK